MFILIGDDQAHKQLPPTLFLRLLQLASACTDRYEPWDQDSLVAVAQHHLKVPWRGAWQPTPVFLPGESHGQRSLAGYCPWGRTELDRTEVTTQHTHWLTFCNAAESLQSCPTLCDPIDGRRPPTKTSRVLLQRVSRP